MRRAKSDRERVLETVADERKTREESEGLTESVFWPNNTVSGSLGEQRGCLWADMAVTEKSNGPLTFQIKMLHCAY